MSEKCFEFTVTVKATEATLQKIQERLGRNTANQLALAELIDEWIKEQLIGPSHYFKVQVQAEVVPGVCHDGLNADEWLASQKFTPQPALDYSLALD
jgi:hypothetical protein